MVNQQKDKNTDTSPQKGKFKEFFEPLLSALIIALIIRAVVIYPFRIPTGSMKNTLLVGDFLLANKFVYGIRSPDWIGIPYTKAGFKIPFFRTPGFRKPKQGDVVIFKYPCDDMLNYIKRCVAVSGDTLQVINKVVYVNGKVFPNPPRSRFTGRHYEPEEIIDRMYPPGAGNIDYYGPVRIPAPGDTFHFLNKTKKDTLWATWMQIAAYEGHDVTYKLDDDDYLHLSPALFDPQNMEPNMPRLIKTIEVRSGKDFAIDGHTLDDYVYTVKNRHYFMMGDNRDDSLDSRYWGFLPERNVVGEALVIYWSWNSQAPMHKKIRLSRILNLIH